MGCDFGLPILKDTNLNELESIINSKYELNLRIPYDNINKWKSQFLKL